VSETPVRPLRSLPKAHLHLHMEAALSPEGFARVAASCGGPVPSAIPSAIPSVDGKAATFADFADTFLGLVEVLSRPGAFPSFFQVLAEEALADGVVHVELAVSPDFYRQSFGDADRALLAMLAAAEQASTATGVEISLMVTVDRTRSADEAMDTAELAVRYAGRGVSALGLANDEVGHPAAAFGAAFELARTAGLRSTPHAGELLGAAAVLEAVEALGADRVQHGIRAVEDPQVLRRLVQGGICLDVCPTSNVALGIVPDLSAHPLPALLAAGVACTINADDPTIFGAGLLREYENCRQHLELDDVALAACARTSILRSAATEQTRRTALAGIQAWLAEQPLAEGTDT